MRFSERARAITPSSTFAFDARAKEMVRKGIDVVSFGTGEPDFDTPKLIQDAGIEAIQKGITRYTPVTGLLPLREAICRKMKEDHGLSYEPSQVLVSSGAKMSLYTAFQVLLSPGDEVLIPAPYWVSYVEQVKLADGVPVIVPSTEKDGFRIKPAALRKYITPKTRVLLLNSPSNPSGAVYTEAEIRAIAEVALEHNLTIVSDEIYEKLIYDGNSHFSIAQVSPEMQERTILINGVSKTYAMTGWRIGYAVGPKDAIKLMANLQGHSTSNASSIGQYASITALTGSQDAFRTMKAEFEKRRNLMVERVNKIPGFSCRKPEGAFYVFANISELLHKTLSGVTINSGDDLADVLLDHAHVAVIPGSGFGMPDFVRFSYATSINRIEEGLDRINRYLSEQLKLGEVV